MEKLLIKKIVRGLICLALASVFLFAGILWTWGQHQVYHEMGQVLEQEEKFYLDMQKMMQNDDTMQNLLLRIPTTHDNAMFALDKNTGEILGAATENNPLLTVKNICKEESFLEVISEAQEQQIIKVKRSYVFLKTRTVDNVIFVDLRLTTTVFKQTLWIFFNIAALFMVLILLSIFVIRRYFRIYVFDEINAIEQTVQRLINGDEEATFKNSTSEELQSIVEALNDWNNNIQHAQKKLNWAIKATNPNAAMFECMSYLNVAYHSDNMQSVLGLSNEKWEAIQSSTENFKAYFNELDTLKNEEHIVKVGDKYLKLKIYQMEQDYFGIVIDKTDSEKRKEQQSLNLQQAVENSETDSLTGLLNRRGFETNVKFLSKGSFDGAVMLMMDVDNFKTVNDTLGHPEGDILLQKVGNCLKEQFRTNDIVARFGGDEFAVFLASNINEDILLKKLNQVHLSLAIVLREYANCGVSISIGAAYTQDEKTKYEKIYEYADEALYRAKRGGKDRYEITVM